MCDVGFLSFSLHSHPQTHLQVREHKLCNGDSPLTVRCTQLPLWKVSYCCSSIRTLHSYQPWSSERTGSICREAFPCREALPRDRWKTALGLTITTLRLSFPVFLNTCMLFSSSGCLLHWTVYTNSHLGIWWWLFVHHKDPSLSWNQGFWTLFVDFLCFVC